MSWWLAKSRKESSCDVCGEKIKKGQLRACCGYKCLAYTMIDRIICLKCLEKEDPDRLIEKLKITQSLESFDEAVKELIEFKRQI